MIVDTSALVAILLNESDAQRYQDAITETTKVAMSAASALECCMVMESERQAQGAMAFDLVVREIGIELMPFDAEQLAIARIAFRRFGKKSKHAARLNFGDCISYALSKATGRPLLFKGDDFKHTDVESAL